jgi:hypothetical protein
MKTRELKDGILNWAVDKALNLNTPYNSWGQKGRVPFYSTDWAQGGPIIEREMIELVPQSPALWDAMYRNQHIPHDGPTPLVAAMRCFVALKLGDEVDVPDDVLRDAELDDLIYDRGDA